MKSTVRTPTLADLKAAGYTYDIKHNRVSKVAYTDLVTGKIVTTTVTGKPITADAGKASDVLWELLPKGGLTEVYVTDPVTSAEFYGYARCRDDENYNKAAGVTKALGRVASLMLVTDGRDGFTCKLSL